MTRQTSRIVVVDSALRGDASPLRHSLYAIVYVPSWLRLRYSFEWSSPLKVFKTLETMKEYFNAAPFQEKPLRAQRCLYSIKALHVYGYKRDGTARFSAVSREQLSKLHKDLQEYLANNPVVAWDWVVSWAECRAMAEAFPNEYIRLYRKLRSHHATKRKPKLELTYFLNIMSTVAKEVHIEMEYK